MSSLLLRIVFIIGERAALRKGKSGSRRTQPAGTAGFPARSLGGAIAWSGKVRHVSGENFGVCLSGRRHTPPTAAGDVFRSGGVRTEYTRYQEVGQLQSAAVEHTAQPRPSLPLNSLRSRGHAIR
jgi:hypothetical protein